MTKMTTKEFGIDIRLVPILSLEANNYNPNALETALFENLVETTRAEGMNQPVLCRPHPTKRNKFIIVDGENRWSAAKIAGLSEIVIVVVNYDETTAKLRTISYNTVKGQNVPMKLAKLLVDLQKTYSDVEIMRLTGITQTEQETTLKLLAAPEFTEQSGVRLTSSVKPVNAKAVHLMLSEHEYATYTDAVKAAINLAGEDITILIGNEVTDYNKAMTSAMGIAGIKMRNVALANICQAYLNMTKEQKVKAAEEVRAKVIGNRTKDSVARIRQREKTDKKVGKKGA